MSKEVKTKEKIDLDPKYIIKLAVTLFLTCVVVAGALGFVNKITAPNIAAINKAKTEEAMKAVVADAENSYFSDALEITPEMQAAAASAGGSVTEFYEVNDGVVAIGHALKIVASGSQGSIEMMVGLDLEGTVTGVSVVKNSETAGIGSKVMENEPNTKGVGVNRPGSFAEYLVIPATNVWKCSDDISADMYAIFDLFGNAVHTALSFPLVGEDVLVSGAGPIGIMAAAVAKFAGARKVVITDVNEYRLGLANKLGIEHTVNVANTSLRDVMNSIGMKEGFDVALEMSGNPAAFNTMLDSMANGGKIAILGLHDTRTNIDWSKVIFNGLTLKGIYGREMFETWYKMNAMLQGGLDISPIITHKFDVKDYIEGFETMNSGNSGKVILDWTNI